MQCGIVHRLDSSLIARRNPLLDRCTGGRILSSQETNTGHVCCTTESSPRSLQRGRNRLISPGASTEQETDATRAVRLEVGAPPGAQPGRLRGRLWPGVPGPDGSGGVDSAQGIEEECPRSA